MKDYFTDILLVIASSGRTQVAIILGILGFIVIQIVGDYALNNFQLFGNLSILTDTIKEIFDSRHDKAAWANLIGFWGIAIKFYQKDKKKFWNHYL